MSDQPEPSEATGSRFAGKDAMEIRWLVVDDGY